MDDKEIAPESLCRGEKHQDRLIDVAHLGPGCSFGEQNLTSKVVSYASFKCLKRTHFMVISKQNYEKALAEIQYRKVYEIASFVRGLPLFQKLSRKFIHRLSSLMTEQKFIKNKVVYREQDPAQYIYIVKDGLFSLTKKLDKDKGMLGKTPTEKEDEMIQEILQDPLASKNIQQFQATKKRARFEELGLAQVGKGNMLGIEDVEEDKETTYSQTATCFSENGVLLKIDKEELLSRLKHHPQVWTEMMQENVSKVKKNKQQIEKSSSIRSTMGHIVYKPPQSPFPEDLAEPVNPAADNVPTQTLLRNNAFSPLATSSGSQSRHSPCNKVRLSEASLGNHSTFIIELRPKSANMPNFGSPQGFQRNVPKKKSMANLQRTKQAFHQT